ncbi:hypothetical protein [Streptomyces sp. MUSC 125]|nr:hypothetical protein [Streptomyces sp. MUSC 125]
MTGTSATEGGVYKDSGTATALGGVFANSSPDNCAPSGAVTGCSN